MCSLVGVEVVKIFKKRTDDKPYVIQDNTDNEEQSNEDHGDAGSKESELQLIVDIRGESEDSVLEMSVTRETNLVLWAGLS